VGHPFGGAHNVRLVIGLRADAGNAQKFEQVVQMLVVLAFDVLREVHVTRPLLKCAVDWMTFEIIARNLSGSTRKQLSSRRHNAGSPGLQDGNSSLTDSLTA